MIIYFDNNGINDNSDFINDTKNNIKNNINSIKNINPIRIKNIVNDKMLEQYFQTKYDILQFDTDEGIFEIANDKIYKIPEKPKLEHYQFSNEISFMIQKENSTKKEIYYIPLQYTYIKKNIKKYKLHPSSLLTLVLVNDNEIYFETPELEITESVKEDLITFLSMLKLYK